MSPSRLDTARVQSIRLSRGFLALAAMTYGLMVLGALVRAHGAGLSCPDWPLCFGQLVPAFDMKVAFEWSHRGLAGLVSLGLAGGSVVLYRSGRLASVRANLAVAWLLLGVQVVLGGLTVLLRLAPWTVVAHLGVGTSFAISLLWLSRGLAEHGVERRREAIPRGVAVGVALVAFVLVLQIALGGMVSSSGAGPACGPAFPDCLGRGWFPTLEGLIGLHVLHRANGMLLVLGFSGLLAAVLVCRARLAPRLVQMAGVAAILVWLQLGVGAANVILALPVELTGLHTALAAALALLTSLMVREVWLSMRVRRTDAKTLAAARRPAVQGGIG